MGTTSDKLTYLNETKTQLRTNINALGASLDSDDTFRSYVTALDNIWETLPKVTGTGTSLSLATKSGKMKVNLLGNTSQTEAPTPSSPIPVNVVSGDNTIVSTGKNFFNLNRTLGTPSDTAGGNTTKRTFDISTFIKGLSVNNYYNEGIDIDYTFIDNGIKIKTNQGGYALSFPLLLKPNTTYTISANISPIGVERLRTGYYQKDGTFISFEINYGTDNYFSFTTPANAYYTLIHLTPSVNTEVTFTNIQLELGNTATTYQEFQGSTSYPIHLGEYELCKISTYQDRFIRTTGKNLFNSNLKQGGRYFSDGAYFNANNYVHNENPISVIAGETYTLSANNYSAGSEAGFVFFNNGTFVSSSKQSSQTFTVPNGANQVYCDFYNDLNITPNDFTDIQLELGSTATSYEPYGTNEWYLEKKIGKVVLNGSEYWIDEGGSAPYALNLDNFYKNNSMSTVMSNYYYGTYWDANWNNYSYLVSANTAASNVDRVKFKNVDISSLADWKTWLGTHNTIVYYVLKTPTYTKIEGTLAEQLEDVWRANSYKGTTNISQVNNDLPFNLSVTALGSE